MPERFEKLVPYDIEGKLNPIAIYEELPENETNIIRTRQNWGVKFQFEMNGDMANDPLMFPTRWHITMKLEGIGLGTEYDLPSPDPLVLQYRDDGHADGSKRRYWDVDLQIPHNTVDAGVYKMALTVQLFTPPITNPADPFMPRAMVVFSEGVMIQLYNDEP